MRKFTIVACIAITAFACNQPSTSEEKTHKPAPDLIAENVKGKVQQIVTETYLIDSATGKMGKLESKSTEIYDDNGYTASYSNYTASDSATTLTKFERDANGYMTGITTTKNDKPVSSLKLMVDSMGKYTSATSFDSTGKMDMYYAELASNDFGEITGGKGYHTDSTIKMTFTNTYDSAYYTGGEGKDSVGKITYSSIIKLNDKKDAAQSDETSITKDSTTKTTTMYAYDKWDDKSNWTQQSTTENGKPKKIMVRTITYK